MTTYRFYPFSRSGIHLGTVIDTATNQIIEDRITFADAKAIWPDLQEA